MVTTQLELLAEQEHIKPSNHLTYFGHLSGLKGFLRRHPTAQDLAGLLSAIENKTPGGINITQFAVKLYAPGGESELIMSQDGLERYLSSSDELTKSGISSDLPDHEFVHFVCNGLPCEGSIYKQDFIDRGVLYQGISLVPGCAGLAVGAAATFGAIAVLAYPETQHLFAKLAPTAVVSFSVSYAHMFDISRSSLNLNLFYTGPSDKISPERQAYDGFVKDLKQFKL